MKTKSIGIFGLGKETTLFYLKRLHTICVQQNKEQKVSSIHLIETDFDTINNLLPKPSKQLEEIMQAYLEELIKLDVAQIIIPNITLHETIDRLKIGIPILHPVHLTALEIKNHTHKSAVLFASKYTMESDYIKSVFEEYDIAINLPTVEEMAIIDEVRKQEYQKAASKDLLDSFNLMIKKYAQNIAVVIACTELSVASTNGNKMIFDMTRIQIREILK